LPTFNPDIYIAPLEENYSEEIYMSGSLATPCDPGTITESSLCSDICLRNVSLPRCYTNDQDFLSSGQLNSTSALKLRPYLSPAYLFPRYSTSQQPRLFPNFHVALQVLPTLAIFIVRFNFTKLKIILSYMRAV